MLKLRSVTAGYGESTVLRDVDFSVGDGEVVALLGPNGAGKTTLLRTATGFVKPRSGRIEFDGEDLTGRRSAQLRPSGYVPPPRRPGHLPLAHRAGEPDHPGPDPGHRRDRAEATELFPVLGNRLRQTAGSLSGGEQQMLALSRAYTHQPQTGPGRRGVLGPRPR